MELYLVIARFLILFYCILFHTKDKKKRKFLGKIGVVINIIVNTFFYKILNLVVGFLIILRSTITLVCFLLKSTKLRSNWEILWWYAGPISLFPLNQDVTCSSFFGKDGDMQHQFLDDRILYCAKLHRIRQLLWTPVGMYRLD